MFIGSPHHLSKVGDKPVLINNASITSNGAFTCLKVELDGKLNWKKHIDSIFKRSALELG